MKLILPIITAVLFMFSCNKDNETIVESKFVDMPDANFKSILVDNEEINTD